LPKDPAVEQPGLCLWKAAEWETKTWRFLAVIDMEVAGLLLLNEIRKTTNKSAHRAFRGAAKAKQRCEMEKIWLKYYDNGVAHTLQPYPERTLVDVISSAALQRPAHPALFFKGAYLSYAQVEHLSNALANALIELGIQKGDRVALMMPNCPQWVISELATWKVGAIVVPVSPLLAEPEVRRTLNDCGAKVAIVLTPFYDKIKAAQANTQLCRIIATNIKEYLPAPLRILFSALKEKKEGHRISLEEGDSWLGELLKQYAVAPRPNVTVSPEDTALFIYTGGTTGTPKAALGTHRTLLSTAMQLHAWFGVVIEDWDDVLVGNMPLFHAFGIFCLAGAQVGHNPVALIPDPRDLDDLLGTIKRKHAALLPGVPTLFTALSNHPKVKSGKADLSSLKLCASGAAPLMKETKCRFEQLTGGRIVECYSLTEAMVAAVITPVLGMYKPGSVGIPLPDVEVRITDAETGIGTLAAGQVGEILMRAQNLMQAYWQHPEETDHTLRDGWLYTGDLGYMDEDGYLFIVDRKKDLVKPGGKQVWPREVEEVIASHPAVVEVGVAGVPDERLGEAVKAWVVLRAGQELTVDELRDYCKQSLAAYKVPKQIVFLDSLPKSAVGKVLRRELVNLKTL
jgi:long-chain acyl-CoA synthetase